MVEEIRWLKERYGFDHIWMCDDIFGLKPGWVHEFAELVEGEKLLFRFKIQSRADLLMQENYVAALTRAGCENSWMGAESGSQKILDAMDKGTTVEQIAGATRLLREYGIRASFFIQFGYPGETMEDIELTIRMIKNTDAGQHGDLRFLSVAGNGLLRSGEVGIERKGKLDGFG